MHDDSYKNKWYLTVSLFSGTVLKIYMIGFKNMIALVRYEYALQVTLLSLIEVDHITITILIEAYLRRN